MKSFVRLGSISVLKTYDIGVQDRYYTPPQGFSLVQMDDTPCEIPDRVIDGWAAADHFMELDVCDCGNYPYSILFEPDKGLSGVMECHNCGTKYPNDTPWVARQYRN